MIHSRRNKEKSHKKNITCITFWVVEDGRYEDEVTRLHVLLPVHRDGQCVVLVSLVPSANPEAKVFLHV